MKPGRDIYWTRLLHYAKGAEVSARTLKELRTGELDPLYGGCNDTLNLDVVVASARHANLLLNLLDEEADTACAALRQHIEVLRAALDDTGARARKAEAEVERLKAALVKMKEIRNSSPNAFYAQFDALMKTLQPSQEPQS